MLLHFPIVLFFIVFVLDGLFVIGKIKKPCYSISHWMVIIAAAMALLTVITGLYAAQLGHEGNSYVILHRNWAFTTLAYSIGHAILRGYVIRKKKVFSAYIFVLVSLINLGLISVTAEYRGLVTQGKDLFMQYLTLKTTITTNSIISD